MHDRMASSRKIHRKGWCTRFAQLVLMPIVDRPTKKPFNIPTMFRRIEAAVAEYPEAAMFELARRGYRTLFQQLVGCIISIRTYDEVSLPVSIALLEVAPDAEAMSRMSAEEIDDLIRESTFHGAKARQIRDIAVRVTEEFGGDLPCDFTLLTSFNGVGPKCANLALGVACGAVEIAVDVHVNRVTTRWGYIEAGDAEQARRQLEAKLPKKYWVEINRLLVPFGKHVCTGRLPKCSTCPVLEYCAQVGVKAHR
jgi:endonuclease-3